MTDCSKELTVLRPSPTERPACKAGSWLTSKNLAFSPHAVRLFCLPEALNAYFPLGSLRYWWAGAA